MIARIATKASCLLILTIVSFACAAKPIANFTANNVSGCSPLVVYFTDISTDMPTAWKWDLGNGTVSFLQNPSVTYFNSGQYTIKLIVSNSKGSDTIVKTKYISVFANPTVQFSSNVKTGCYPLPVQFQDNSNPVSGTIDIWQWDFGDGFSSGLQNPLHTFKYAGSYNITLRVRNSNGCITTLSKQKYIEINTGVLANFDNSMPNNCSVPVSINFKNTSTGNGVLSYKWFFGDGMQSSQKNPSHSYTDLGSYTVKLIVTNISGCTDTIVKVNAIVAGKVTAAFIAPDSACVQQYLMVKNLSTPTPLSQTWSFGDGTFDTASTPTKTYAKAGIYTIKYVANFGSCSDSSSRKIIIKLKPASIFNADIKLSCSIPLRVNFTNQSLNSIAWFWDFGDGTTSTLESPAHNYIRTGVYTVKLISTNSNGCTDTLQKTDFINIQKPKISLQNLPDSGCAPFTKKFSCLTKSIDSVVSYLWKFGDNTTSASATPSHTYVTDGTYTVTVIITTEGGCIDSATMQKAIIVNVKPNVDFRATPTSSCAKTEIFFTDLVKVNITSWLWQFGDGATSTAQNPKHYYSDTGRFAVQLTVKNNGCSNTKIVKDYINIIPPVAAYIFKFDCKKPYERVFIDQSVGGDVINWNFGDGTTSNERNPVHTYAEEGNYSVVQTVRNNKTICDITATKTIKIVDVVASFTTSDSLVCRGGTLNFITDLSTSDVTNFNWNFGDNESINTPLNSTSHTYKTAGNYNIGLTITSVLGCKNTLLKTSNIRVNGPTAKFNLSVPGSCLNNAVIFNNQSVSDGINTIKSYTWNYGDNVIETLLAPPFTHAYIKEGIYPVSLLVTDSLGCTDNFNVAVPLIISKPVANFSTDDTLTCPVKSVTFMNTSTGPNLTYLWDFGDSITSALKQPVHNYNIANFYSVSLTIKDQYGCSDSITKPNYVGIKIPEARFLMSDSLSICPPLIIQFTNQSVNAVNIEWDFGDGTSSKLENPSHFYDYPGTYYIRLTVTGPGGCTTYLEKSIYIKGPTGTFTYTPLTSCAPTNENFKASISEVLSIVWDFNDGTTLNSTDTTVTHTYAHPGSYLPKIILTDKEGCKVPIVGLDTLLVNGVTANFSLSKSVVCDSSTVYFMDSSYSNDVITKYDWNFGDGRISNDKDVVHLYNKNGLYYPRLIVTTLFGCVDTLKVPTPVKVTFSPHIKIETTPNGCTPLAVTLKSLVTVADTTALTWNWNFANGDSSILQNPAPQNFTSSGVYEISLIATNSSGCMDTAYKNIEAYAVPLVSVGPDSFICKNTSKTLHATGAATYTWVPAKGLSCTNCEAPVITPDSASTYIVKGTSIHGCTALDTINIAVIYPFKIRYSKADTICVGQSRKLFATGGYAYVWSPASGLNNNTISSPIAQPLYTTNYSVIAKDEKGCFRDTGFVLMKVYPTPLVNAGVDKTINVGQTFNIIPTISADVTTVYWAPTSGIVAPINKIIKAASDTNTNGTQQSFYSGISIKPNTNTDYIVTVKNNGGCTAQDWINIIVVCDGTNIFVPNTFSPNGDGYNDIFYPRGSGLFKIKTLKIFNRWGQSVFERSSFSANDATMGWNGTFKGLMLNPDVFVYTIEILCDNGSIIIYKGNISVVQ